jgi:hypothetical protein
VSEKSYLRNHRAIAQPRLYDRSMVTQFKFTLNTEPHGFDSCRRRGHFWKELATSRSRVVPA